MNAFIALGDKGKDKVELKFDEYKDNHLAEWNRITVLDWIKAISIILIIITHYSWSAEQRWKLAFPFWIDMAVPIFMIITGYVNAFSLKNSKSLYNEHSVKKLIKYTVPFLLVYLFELIYRSIKLKETLSLMSAFLGFFNGGPGQGAYYFPILYQLVVILPLIYLIIKKNALRGLVICFFLNFLYEILQRAYYVSPETYRLISFRYIFLLAYGCYLTLYGTEGIKIRYYITGFIIGLMFIIGYNYLGYEPHFIVYWQTTCVVTALYLIPIFTLIFYKLHDVRCLPLELIGRASYHVFLFQMLYYMFWEKYVTPHVSSTVVHLLVNIVICVVFGFAFYELDSRFVTGRIINKLKVM